MKKIRARIYEDKGRETEKRLTTKAIEVLDRHITILQTVARHPDASYARIAELTETPESTVRRACNQFISMFRKRSLEQIGKTYRTPNKALTEAEISILHKKHKGLLMKRSEESTGVSKEGVSGSTEIKKTSLILATAAYEQEGPAGFLRYALSNLGGISEQEIEKVIWVFKNDMEFYLSNHSALHRLIHAKVGWTKSTAVIECVESWFDQFSIGPMFPRTY